MDIAIISLMRDALLRVSEAASLRWEDLIDAGDDTGRLIVRRSKTDTEGESVVLSAGNSLKNRGNSRPLSLSLHS